MPVIGRFGWGLIIILLIPTGIALFFSPCGSEVPLQSFDISSTLYSSLTITPLKDVGTSTTIPSALNLSSTDSPLDPNAIQTHYTESGIPYKERLNQDFNLNEQMFQDPNGCMYSKYWISEDEIQMKWHYSYHPYGSFIERITSYSADDTLKETIIFSYQHSNHVKNKIEKIEVYGPIYLKYRILFTDQELVSTLLFYEEQKLMEKRVYFTSGILKGYPSTIYLYDKGRLEKIIKNEYDEANDSSETLIHQTSYSPENEPLLLETYSLASFYTTHKTAFQSCIYLSYSAF